MAACAVYVCVWSGRCVCVLWAMQKDEVVVYGRRKHEARSQNDAHKRPHTPPHQAHTEDCSPVYRCRYALLLLCRSVVGCWGCIALLCSLHHQPPRTSSTSHPHHMPPPFTQYTEHTTPPSTMHPRDLLPGCLLLLLVSCLLLTAQAQVHGREREREGGEAPRPQSS